MRAVGPATSTCTPASTVAGDELSLADIAAVGSLEQGEEFVQGDLAEPERARAAGVFTNSSRVW